MEYPESILTECDTSNLVANKRGPGYSWQGPLIAGDVMPTYVDYDADSHRLFITSSGSSFMYYLIIAIAGFTIAFVVGFMNLFFLVNGEVGTLFTSIFYYSLIIGILFTFILLKFGKLNYFVFDRDHGTVFIPKKIFQKSYTLSFDKLMCYFTTHGGYEHSSTTHTYIRLKQKPKYTFGFHHQIELSNSDSKYFAELQWSFICRFMDKNQLPSLVGITGEWIAFFERNNAIIEDYENGKISKEIIDAFEARMEKIMEQRNRHAA